MGSPLRKVAGWGNSHRRMSQLAQIEDIKSLTDYIQRIPSCIARGNGRSYGDAALASHMVDTRQWDTFLSFDRETGVLHCQAGVLLGDMLRNTIPLGWTLPVLPGTQHITVGGAIAANIHGKNQTGNLLFSDGLLGFEILDKNGHCHTCNREQNANLFRNTCGGMGSTGIILNAHLQLEPITTTKLEQLTIETHDLAHLMEVLNSQRDFKYAAAWYNAMEGTGRAFFARPASDYHLAYKPKQGLNIPFFAPNFLLNKYTLALYNAYYAWKNPVGIRQADMADFFFPLDGIGHWNRLYGRRGLVQYHACFPHDMALAANHALLAALHKMDITPYLVVIKKHRAPLETLTHGFLQEGFSIALDIPNRRNMDLFIRELDKTTLQYQGKVYAAKDGFSGKEVIGLNWEVLSNNDGFDSDLFIRVL
jgi:decaprenylphospho-beta-D-ribofuranose 2-oxidase